MADNDSSTRLTNTFESISNRATILMIIGVVGTVAGFFIGSRAMREQMWWMLLVNFLFWTGLAQGAFVWCAILRTGQATWCAGVNRLARASSNYIWVGIVLWAVLALGWRYWLVWVNEPEAVQLKYLWLNKPFYFIRDGAALLFVAVLNQVFINAYRRLESDTSDRAHNIINRLAIAVVLTFVVSWSLIAFDMVMALEPQWTSTLFGAYFFVGSLYFGMAALIVLAFWLHEPLGLKEYFSPRQFSDMGNLLMGFGILVVYMLFAHLLEIWYGNIPEEITFIVHRLRDVPWQWWALAAFLIAQAAPFILLQSQVTKRTPGRLAGVAVLVLVGMWLERTVLVVPSFSRTHIAGLTNVFTYFIPVMCGSVFLLLVINSLRQNPNVSQLDAVLTLK
ncbi:MAG: hypothetical protein IT209_07565 [Armatimonadetes bacterium]|nr:hypothetical protein [Armatimonadota bacterium]